MLMMRNRKIVRENHRYRYCGMYRKSLINVLLKASFHCREYEAAIYVFFLFGERQEVSAKSRPVRLSVQGGYSFA